MRANTLYLHILFWMLLIMIPGSFQFANGQTAENNRISNRDKKSIEMTGNDSTDADTGQTNKDATEEKDTGDSVSDKLDAEDSIEEKKGPVFKFKGQVKNLYMFHRTDNYRGTNLLYLKRKNLSSDVTRVRLSPEFRYSDMITARVDYDNELIASNYGGSRDFSSYWRPSQYNDLLHLSWEPYHGREVYYRTKIHRGYVKISKDFFALTVGRQQIRFGSGKLWNPLDILNPISPTFVEGGDEQKGTDAVKLDFYPNDKTEITAVVDFKKSSNSIEHFNMQDCNYIGRVKTSIKDTDIAVLGGYISRRGVFGFDFAAIVFDGMLRGSMVVNQAGSSYITTSSPWYSAQYFMPGKNDRSRVFFQANAGYEYNFKKGVYLLVEYFYNQRAINYNRDLKAAMYTSQVNATNQKTYLHLSNLFLTTNQHYLGVYVGYDFHPLVRGEIFIIGDIQGRSIFWGPTIRINAYENLDFIIGMMGAFTINNRVSDFSEFRKNYMYYVSGSYVF